jgi:hypothetical protein
MIGHRRRELICPECGKPIRGRSPPECLGCLRGFHLTCLVRVKKTGGRIWYRMCGKCLEEKPVKRHLHEEVEATSLMLEGVTP